MFPPLIYISKFISSTSKVLRIGVKYESCPTRTQRTWQRSWFPPCACNKAQGTNHVWSNRNPSMGLPKFSSIFSHRISTKHGAARLKYHRHSSLHCKETLSGRMQTLRGSYDCVYFCLWCWIFGGGNEASSHFHREGRAR